MSPINPELLIPEEETRTHCVVVQYVKKRKLSWFISHKEGNLEEAQRQAEIMKGYIEYGVTVLPHGECMDKERWVNPTYVLPADRIAESPLPPAGERHARAP